MADQYLTTREFDQFRTDLREWQQEIKDGLAEIHEIVARIDREGCRIGRYCPVRLAAEAEGIETARGWWTPRRKAAAKGAGVTATAGAVLYAVAELLTKLLDKVPR